MIAATYTFLFRMAEAVRCGTSNTVVDTGCLPGTANANNTLDIILNIVFAIAASIAAMMIVIGGFRLITAGGNPNNVSEARNTIIYSVVGLVVIMAAYGIVTFVVRSIG